MVAVRQSLLRVAVLGPGAIGGLLAGLLARDGHRVVCIGRQATVDALREHGLTVRSNLFGEFTVPVEAHTDLRESVDVCLVATKATSLESALTRVPPSVLGKGLIVPFLNGIEHVALLRKRYPADSVVPATIRAESVLSTTGVILHTSPFASVELASNEAASGHIATLAPQLTHSGIEVNVRDDETAMLWGKLCFLAPLALLTTVKQAPVGNVREEWRNELIALVAEVASVARAEGALGDERSVLELLDQVPASMQSSMQKDAVAGRPVEIDAIGGVVVRAAARHGIAVPVTALLVEEVRSRYGRSAG